MVDDNKYNGYSHCLAENKWTLIQESLEKVNTMNEFITRADNNLGHLPTIAGSITEMRDQLISSATGKDHIPKDVGFLIIKILCLVIVSLIAVIGFLLIGEHFNILKLFHN